ncbi:adenosylcobinamide-GDP ribazoletransferase [Rhodobacteraceae bacterium XHP0102]|nr:adenosylcobinamide-GDP ribazoletransferase [Rhodobacteraceae bacterium XHP0102]
MAHNPLQGSLPKLGDIGVAFALLSRLPLPIKPDYSRGAEAAWAYPIVGAVIGAIGMGLGGAALGIGLPLTVAGLIALGAMIMASGALHEDGLSDVADGFWGGWSVQDRLRIMKDSHVGVYGVVALILSLLLRVSLIITLIAQTPLALIAIAALSRAPMVAMMRYMPNPRSDGLSQKVGQTSGLSTGISAALGLALCVALIGPLEGLAVFLIAGIAAFFLAALAQAKIGGQTGDVLGASQQVSEIAALAACVALLT